MKNKIQLTLFALCMLSISTFAQTGVIKGRVIDAINNEALPFVNVVIEGTTVGAATDIDGNFVISGLKPSFYRLSVSFIGYNTVISDEVQVTNSASAYIELSMQPSETKLDEVVVKASPFRRTEESPIALQSIGLSEIENNPGSNRDISRVIQSFPGVGQSAAGFRSDIVIRGGGPSESKFYLDGVEVPNINHFATQGSSGGPVGCINADFISSVNFYSGAFPSNRGNATSGVFEFTQKDGNKDRIKTRATLGSSDMGLTFDGPIGDKTSFIFSARQSYLQFLFDAIGLPFLPTYNDFQLKVRSRLDDKNEITIVGLGAIDRFKLNLGIENPTEEQKYILEYLPVSQQWNYTNGLVYKHFRDKSYQTFVISRNMLNNTSYKYKGNNNENEKLLNYVSQEMENKMRFEHTTRWGSFKFTGGVATEFAKYTNETYQKLFIGGKETTIEYNSELKMIKYGTFGQISKSLLSERLTLSFGARMDGNNYSESMARLWEQFSPRLSASYMITPKLSINANTGRYYQLPAYTTLGYRTPDGVLKNKENNLRYISADHYIAGFEFRPDEQSKVSIEGFWKNYDKYPFSLRDSLNLANKGGDFGVVGDEEVSSTGTGHAYGFEVLGRINSDKGLTAIASYTFVRSEFADFNGTYRPSAWDNRHIFTMTGSQKLRGNWTVGFKWRYLGGLPYTPIDMKKSSFKPAWDVQGRAYLDVSRLNELRLKPFHQLDVRVDKKFFFNRWSLMLYMDIQNAYNFKGDQPDYVLKTYDEAGNPVFEDQAQMYYKLKTVKSTSGTVVPSIGIMLEI